MKHSQANSSVSLVLDETQIDCRMEHAWNAIKVITSVILVVFYYI